MPGEDQERFEDYLELEQYIEELQAGRVARPPRNLTPAQARIYRMAALFRSASPDAATPRPEFVDALHTRLLAVDQEEAEADTLKIPAVKSARETVTPPPVEEEPPVPIEEPSSTSGGEQKPPVVPELPVVPPPQPRKDISRNGKRVARRSLLTGSAVAAASLVVGTGVGAMAERAASASSSSAANTTATPTPAGTPFKWTTPMVVPNNGDWHMVATLDQIGEGAFRFVTNTAVGYVIRADEDEPEEKMKKGDLYAVSAACTHMGCLVNWEAGDRQFYCPCHGGVFTEYGEASPKGRIKYLRPLPRMQVKVDGDGNVFVQIPKSNT